MRRILSCLFVLSFSLLGPTARADELKYIAKPQEAMAAFFTLAENATKSIDIATFIFEPCDTSTRMLLDILERKARSGVRVRILLDDLGQSGKQKQVLADFAAKNGFEFRFYNTFEKNMRTHIKVMIVDNKTYITGGRNISDKYFGLSALKNYVDRDLLVTGRSATEATASFIELWNAGLTSKKRGNPAGFRGWQGLCPYDDSARRQTVREYLARNPDILSRIPTRSCNNVRYIADHPDFGHARYNDNTYDPVPGDDDYMNAMRMNKKRATKFMLSFIRGSQSSLRMENWVYMPIFYLSDALAEARDRRVVIQGITNRDTEDGPAVFLEAMDYAIEHYSRLHSVGTQRIDRISSFGGISDTYELTPRGTKFFVHGKIFLRDKKDLVVSSFNLDSRSYNTNLESLVVVENCPAIVADAEIGLSKLYATLKKDIATGRVPPKKPASVAAKAFARLALILF